VKKLCICNDAVGIRKGERDLINQKMPLNYNTYIVGFTSSLGAILWEVENTLELYFKK